MRQARETSRLAQIRARGAGQHAAGNGANDAASGGDAPIVPRRRQLASLRAQRGVDLRIGGAHGAQVLFQPVEVEPPGRDPVGGGGRAHRSRVLPVARDAVGQPQDRSGQTDLCVERLVLVEVAEPLVEATHLFGHGPAHEHAARAGRDSTVADERGQRPGRRMQDAGLNTEVRHEIASHVLRLVRPAVPPLCRGVDQPRLGVRVERRDLHLELVRQPDVIRVEERDQLTARGGDCEVARRAVPAVLTAWVREQPDTTGVRAGEPPRGVGAGVRRAVVDEQQLPVLVRLRDHALDRLGEVRLAVLEGDDDGDARRGRVAGRGSAHGRRRGRGARHPSAR